MGTTRFTETMTGYVTLDAEDAKSGYEQGKAANTACTFRLTIAVEGGTAGREPPPRPTIAPRVTEDAPTWRSGDGARVAFAASRAPAAPRCRSAGMRRVAAGRWTTTSYGAGVPAFPPAGRTR